MSPALDRSQPPPPEPVRSFRFPPFEHRRLGRGIELYVAPDRRTPLVYLEILAPAGGDRDPRGAAGLAALTASLLDEGTSRRSAIEIARTAEALGGSLSTSADWDVGFLATVLLSSQFDDGLELLLEVALDPAFEPEEIERLRRRTLAELRARKAQPGSQAQKALYRGLYGDSPYGHLLLGSEKELATIDREQIVSFYRRSLACAPLRVVAAGDVDPDQLSRRLADALGDRGPIAEPARPAIVPRQRSRVEVRIVDRPAAAQTELRVGQPGLARNHPDFSAAAVMNSILGGKFTSRINLNLRERHGYTYGASSGFSRRLDRGPFVVRAAVANEVAAAAATEVLNEIRRIREAPVEAAELDDARNYLLGVFPYTLQTLEGVASRLAELAVYSLPDDYYDQLPRRLATLTAEEIRAVAERHLDPDRLLVVAVGPADELRPQFQALGPVSVIET